DDAIVVATIDEQLTDVTLALTALDADDDTSKPIEVENHLGGAGIEIAALRVPAGSRLQVKLWGAPDATTPGAVHVLVRQYAANADSDATVGPEVSAYLAWAAATRSSLRADVVKKTSLSEMQRAVDEFAKAGSQRPLVAAALLTKARMSHYFKVDQHAARADAMRAAQDFKQSGDEVNAARAEYVEALALAEISGDSQAVDPTPEEAVALARQKLDRLSADGSPLTPIERARALAARGDIELDQMHTDDATRLYEQARDQFKAAGFPAGERVMRFKLPMVRNELGRFTEAASDFDPLLPEIDQLTDPEFRVKSYMQSARAQSMSSRVDEGLDLLLVALPLAREHQLKTQEAIILESIGYIYSRRGDLKQAVAFYEEAMKILKAEGSNEYPFTLAAAAGAARLDGDLERCFKLATEGVRVSTTPIAKARTPLQLGLYYNAIGNHAAAIAQYRSGLAVDLGDPHHHAHTDGRMYIAMSHVENTASTPADLAEADQLLSEALATSTKVRDMSRQVVALRWKGHLEARRGNSGKALANFDRALAVAQAFREGSTSIEARAQMMKDEEGAFRGYLDIVLAAATRRAPGTLQAATPAELAGFRRLEHARQQSFGALRVGALDAATTALVDGLLQQMAQKSLRITTLLRQKQDAEQVAEIHTLQLDMSALHAKLDSLRWSAAAKNARATMVTQEWRAVAPHVMQLSYALGEQHVYVLVRSATGAAVARLAPSRKALEEQLTELNALDPLTASAKIQAAIEQVSAALLPENLLPKDSTAVEIVAEGRIASVPFPALRSPTDPHRRFVETHDIAMSTTLLGVDAAPRPAGARPFRFVALASGDGTYRSAPANDPAPRLDAAIKEIRTAAGMFTARDPTARVKLLTGSEGNATALRDIWASGADVVHFATHALADLRQPVASLLVLPATDSSGQSTYLTAGEVQAWHGDTELVFLSACESAIGPPQYAAGMPGLQRAFLRAGARGVIATLAPVEDIFEQQFAADFYRRFTTGETALRALSETQRLWLTPKRGMSAEEQMRRRITALSHAYFAG
ncbi:MAG TPA: CHAT domain-containing tetratricopeptide repeat protein, partial [Steroidobacteraceae bacterium]|nr:CHAT domain-containing tetratricopeptide repeat protein [Steroidobacteraceae bacterium]